MIEKYGAKHYYRFCDKFILGESKRELWELRDKLHQEAEEMGLTIKPSEKGSSHFLAGMDALGYVNYGDYALLRKRTKVNAAKKLSRIKSRKRRQQLIVACSRAWHVMQTANIYSIY